MSISRLNEKQKQQNELNRNEFCFTFGPDKFGQENWPNIYMYGVKF